MPHPRTFRSFDAALRALGTFEGVYVEAHTEGHLLSAIGLLKRSGGDAILEGLGDLLVEAEAAEAFDVGESGRIAFFRSDFRSATYFEDRRRELAIRPSNDVVIVSDYLWNK